MHKAQSNDKAVQHGMHGNLDNSTNKKHTYNNTQYIKSGSLKSNNNDKNITQMNKINKTNGSSSGSYSSSSSSSSSETLKEDCIVNKNTILAYYKKSKRVQNNK